MAYSHQKENKTQFYTGKGVRNAVRQKTDTRNESSGSSSDGEKKEFRHPQVDGVVMRKPREKKKPREDVFSRRITCHNLGPGTCEGWLLKKSENRTLISKSWIRMFFKLKEFVLYYYKDIEADKATGVICLAGFVVTHSNKRKWAMKIFHQGTGKKFHIAAERESDWETWLKHLQLAATVYANPDNVRSSRIFTGIHGDDPPATDAYSGYHSESDDEEDEKQGFTREHIVDTVAKLSALRRTIEAKRRALKEMDKLLEQNITSESIKVWERNHPDLLEGILTNHSRNAKRDGSMSDENEGGIASGNAQHLNNGTPAGLSADRQQVGGLKNNGPCLSDGEKNKVRLKRSKEPVRRKHREMTRGDGTISTRL